MSQDMKAAAFGSLSYEEQLKALQPYMVPVGAGRKVNRSCGDGRKASNGDLFIKNFGGSLGAATVLFVSQWRAGNKKTYGETVETALQGLGTKFDLGGHRDEHSEPHPTNSGCGYADNRAAIVNRVANTEGFGDVVNSVFKGAINEGNQALWDGIVATYQDIAKTQSDGGFTPTGEELIKTLESKDASSLILEGAHEEYAIVFNYAENITLDTNKLVDDGGSAFCVDIWDAMAQSSHLGVGDEEAKLIYMAEWVATALVLVVDKGNPLPPIFFIPGDFSA